METEEDRNGRKGSIRGSIVSIMISIAIAIIVIVLATMGYIKLC